ncbi:MAG: alpha/beta hydrolase [Clostridium sp.]|uniref:alpha/beta hydrolase n=1 Tax=Clostridium sp. TaxID=1506 RepID=UPI003D6D84C7
MGKITYTKLINATLNLYMKEDYLEAYNFISKNSIGIKVNEAQIYNFRYSIACKAGLTGIAMEIMREAIVEKGYWYSYEYLIADDDLNPLKKYSEFDILANICKDREAKAKINSKPDIKIIKPNNIPNNEKQPLLIALHGNEENIIVTEDYWSSCVDNNYILALPQSSEIGFSNGYYWNNLEKGCDELKEEYDKVLQGYNINLDNIIIGGFSAGARVALYAMLKDLINAKGFIFVGPWLPEINEWEHLLDKLKSKGVKGYIICGDKDEDCLDCTESFVRMLNERNIPNVFKVVKDLEHDYPDNFDGFLDEGIEFISN